MLAFRRKHIACVLLGTALWISCGLGLVGMYDARAARAAMASMAPISRGQTGANNVALMFNVDWGEEYIPGILQILKERGAPATFFLTGSWAEKNASLAMEIAESGHEIGNHGAVHSHIETMPKANTQRLIESGEQRILAASGVRPSRLFAPPYGEWTEEIVISAAELGYHTVLWTVDTVDWRLPPPETIWKRALAGAVPGALILLHPTEPTTLALPLIIDGLIEKGFTLTTVTDCILGSTPK